MKIVEYDTPFGAQLLCGSAQTTFNAGLAVGEFGRGSNAGPQEKVEAAGRR